MIQYNGPIGADVVNPDSAFLKDIIFNKQADYWKQGSGDSCIESSDCEERLMFFYDEPYGFFVMCQPDYLVLVDRDKPIVTVTHTIGGEPMKVPTCSYISREAMYELVDQFLSSHRIPTGKEWVDIYSIDFDHDYK